jgi:hypothetical protein
MTPEVKQKNKLVLEQSSTVMAFTDDERNAVSPSTHPARNRQSRQ